MATPSPGGRMPTSTAGEDARRYNPAMNRQTIWFSAHFKIFDRRQTRPNTGEWMA
ncbi:MAG: hypothetical protein HOP33_01295 [Verrucomicrobia bacterium]|nr:hypothetical protein [Verrucomicrobiota bacterium]